MWCLAVRVRPALWIALHLNLIGILMLIWQHRVAEVTSLTSVEMFVSFICSKDSGSGENHGMQGCRACSRSSPARSAEALFKGKTEPFLFAHVYSKL